jgi:uncharacterized membrane protein YedE/YeeE
MALVGACGLGTLIRLGGGDLRALVTLMVLAVAAYATMRGLPGLFRVHAIEAVALDLGAPGRQGLARLLAWLLWPEATVAAAVAFLLAFALWQGHLIGQKRLALMSVLIGAATAFGWLATGVVGQDEFDPTRPQSFAFVAPVGETILYLMTATGNRLDFAEGSVAGVIFGALAAARLGGEFRWEAYDDSREMRRHLLGAALMGFGGVTALGCTIGQGLAGISTLSIGSPIAVLAMIAGARVGLYWLIERPLA